MSKWRRRKIKYTEGDQIEPCNMRKERVEAYAENVAVFANFDVGDDPADIVEQLGGNIEFQELDEWASESGSIFVHDSCDFDILLSHYTSPLRDKFTVAHELGHYFLHSNQGDIPIIAHRAGSGRVEWEANWFAAGLLMPSDRFKIAWKKYGDLSRVASEFGVSEDAARVRRDALFPK